MTMDSSEDMEQDLILTRLKERTSSSRIEGLQFLRAHLSRNNGMLSLEDKEAVFNALSLALEDTHWNIRHQVIQVLRDMIPKFGPQLDDLYMPMLPQLIENIGDNKVEVRKDVVQTLHTYMKHCDNVAFMLQLYLEYGLQGEEEKVQRESIINLPVLISPEFAHEDLFEITQALISKLPGNEESRSIWRSLDRLKLAVGDDRFEGYISNMPKDLQEVYSQRLGAGSQTPGANSSSPVQSPHTSMTARELAAKLTGVSENQLGRNWLEFGIIRPECLIKLNNQEDWSLRFHGIEDLKSDVTNLSDIAPIKPHLVPFINFLCQFLKDEVNFKITMSALEIFVVLIKKLGAYAAQYVESLAAALSHRMGDSKIVIRQINIRAFRELMYTATPMPVLKQILPCLKHRNSRNREETINVIISALLTFPTTDFDFATLCDTISPCLVDPKRRVRQASLEVFAVLAQLMGVNNLKPLIRAIEVLEPEFGDGPMNAIKARVARRQLPMIREDGMVDYATVISSSSASSSAASSTSSSKRSSANAAQFGADIDWILKASGSSRGGGGNYGPPPDSASSRSISESIPTDSAPNSASIERRAVVLSSAGKKLPWDSQQVNGGNDHEQFSNSFKKPLINPPRGRNNFGKANGHSSEELDSGKFSSGYASMRTTARPVSDTVTARSRMKEGAEEEQVLPMKAQLVRSATNRAHPPPGGGDSEDFPLDEKALSSVRNSAARKKAERRGGGENEADSTPYTSSQENQLYSNGGGGGANGHHRKTSDRSSRSVEQQLNDLPVDNYQQKVETYTAIRKSYNASLYREAEAFDDPIYNSAPVTYPAFDDEQPPGGVSSATQRKIDDLKEKKKREKEERRAERLRQREDEWVVDYGDAPPAPSVETGRNAPSSAPATGKPASNSSPAQRKVSHPTSKERASTAVGAATSPEGEKPPVPQTVWTKRSPVAEKNSASPVKPPPPPPFAQAPQLRSSPEVELKRAMNLISNPDWNPKMEGMALLQTLSEKHPEALGPQMHDINLAVIAEVRNLRSQVSRQAIHLMRVMFKNLERSMDQDVELTVGCLLQKTGDSNGFIRDDVEKALCTMAEKVSPHRAIAALIAGGTSSKNKEIRKTTSYIMCIILERVLDTERGVKSRETILSALPPIAQFAVDNAPEPRYYGKKMLWLLMLDDPHSVEMMMQKVVQPQNLLPIKKLMENLRANGGPGDHPNETPLAKLSRRPSYNSRTFSGSSNRGAADRVDEAGDGPGLAAPANGTYPPPGGGSGRARGAAPAKGRGAVDDRETIQALCVSLKAGDFRERENAINTLVDLASSRPDLIGHNISAVFDEFVPRLTDSNSKVNVLALQSMLALVPLLRDYFSTVANMVVPAVAQNMASNRPELRSLSTDIIDAMLDHIDQTSLLQPLSTLAKFGNNRVRPEIVFKLATLVTLLYPRKPQMVIRHVLPVLWQLVTNLSGSGATPGSSANLRQAAQRLATNLYSLMGQALFDMAESEMTTPRNKFTLKQLVEVS